MRKNRLSDSIWVFGDYRNYFQNRVTLQLIAKGKELAKELDKPLIAVVLGDQIHQYAMEYVAHGADVVVAGEDPGLMEYQVDTYTAVLARWIEAFKPQILLAGATSFGREFFPRLAKRLHTGLSADCVALDVEKDTGLLVQTTPSFGGELLAEVITPDHKPQMATVHPGIFRELPHDPNAFGCIIYPEIGPLPEIRVKRMRTRPQQTHDIRLEDAAVVIAGGIGLGSKELFGMLSELADLLGGDVGATRPAVYAGWAEEERLLGQTGKNVRPKLLISVGTSGALQYTTGIQGAETIIAINRDPNAPIFKIADLGLIGDAVTVLPLLLDALRKRV